MIRSSMRRYAKGVLCGPVGTHRASIGALCKGCSMRLYIALSYFQVGNMIRCSMRRYAKGALCGSTKPIHEQCG